MRPIAEMPRAVRDRIQFVLTDVDDTLTERGRLPAASYGAMERLKERGRRIIPVTGRPAGWCDLIARQWPVDAVIGENGALAFRYDDATRRMHRLYAQSPSERKKNRARLDGLAKSIPAQVPGAAVAEDQDYRIADLAIDFAEDVPRLPEAAVRKIVAMFEAAGATAKVSSIHVNGWYGHHDKLSMTSRALDEFFAVSYLTFKDLVAFIGDSPNDAPMFGYFPNSVGVANVRDFAEGIEPPPEWITSRRSAQGFCEFVDRLLMD